MLQKILHLSSALVVVLTLFTVGCSAQTEEQALANLRSLTRDGQLPPENIVADIESRFSGRRAGALARLVHARIRYDAGDFAGAAALLNTDVFRKKTKVADEALWLRMRALQQAGNHGEAMRVADELLREFPESIRVRDTKLIWATSAIAAERAVEVPPFLVEMSEKNDAEALLVTAKAYETQSSSPEAVKYYRRTYFFAAGTPQAQEAEAKLTSMGQSLNPQTADEQLARADRFAAVKNYAEAANAYNALAAAFPSSLTPAVQLRRLTALAGSARMADAQSVFASIAPTAKEREEAYRQMVLGYARAKQWPQARTTADEMRVKFPTGTLEAKTLIDAGLAARDAKNNTDAAYFFNTAVAAYPNAVEVAQAQFEAAWTQHDANNYAISSQMLTEHLARYADKDTSNRGKAGYWSARDSERAGKIAEACALYDGVLYRYAANWYGYLAANRIANLRSQGQCRSTAPPNETVRKAITNLRTVTVAAETATQRELDLAAKSDELAIVGLFDWAIEELNDAKRTAGNSPKINLVLASYYRLRGDNTSAMVAMQKSYPDYAQMFPEEMGKEEWSYFYPLSNWREITQWASNRGLDRYQVAGIIRQETVFTPRAKSGANAYGLMQLLLPTAKTMARSYGSSIMPTSPEDLYQPALNIELGTAYMKDQFAKFGRIEFVAVAYNAGPNRVPQWRATLPAEIDEFVEAIPFKETKQYVQGVVRNSAQYRRLYDDNGGFRSNVGTRPLRGLIDEMPREQFTAENPDIAVDDTADEQKKGE
ncbi:MAG TPA: lytic transglycosylase domain-containing protein [Pyrinomonadaceae bacterium]|nr:lytic transglycosylase domain-containing protein [Pyrinomonadaceae bacterium]